MSNIFSRVFSLFILTLLLGVSSSVAQQRYFRIIEFRIDSELVQDYRVAFKVGERMIRPTTDKDKIFVPDAVQNADSIYFYFSADGEAFAIGPIAITGYLDSDDRKINYSVSITHGEGACVKYTLRREPWIRPGTDQFADPITFSKTKGCTPVSGKLLDLTLPACARIGAGEDARVARAADASPTPVDQSAGAASVAPRDPRDGRVVGGSAELVVDSNGNKSIRRPKVWLAYSVQDKGNTSSEKAVRVDLSPDAEKLLDNYWDFLLNVRDLGGNRLQKLNDEYLRTLASVRETHVKTPYGERALSDYEADDLVEFMRQAFISFHEKRLSQPNPEPSN